MPAGKFLRAHFAALAEDDRERILEKTKAGQQVAAPGQPIARPKVLGAENVAKVKRRWKKGGPWLKPAT